MTDKEFELGLEAMLAKGSAKLPSKTVNISIQPYGRNWVRDRWLQCATNPNSENPLPITDLWDKIGDNPLK